MERTENINCNVVRDLLPLYADDILSADSRALVDAHLPVCPPCSDELEALRKPAKEPKFNATKGLQASRKRLRRIIIMAAAATAVIVGVLCFVSIRPSRQLGPDVTIPFQESPINVDKLYAFHGAPGSHVGEGDFLFIQPNRLPRFEWAGFGEQQAEDVIMIDGARTGVAYIHMTQTTGEYALGMQKYKRKGANKNITALGSGSIRLSPMTQTDKTALVKQWDDLSGQDNSGAYERANFARDIPITKVYYYNGPGKNLKNEALGWSERGGILKDCVLLWDAATAQQSDEIPAEVQYFYLSPVESLLPEGETTAPFAG